MSSSERIFSAQEKIFHECVSSLTGKTPNQMKTLTGTILPRVALYKALRARRPSAPAATAAISTSSASPDKDNSEKIVKKQSATSIGISNRTLINRLSVLAKSGFVEPIFVYSS